MKYTIRITGKYGKTIIRGVPGESIEKWMEYIERKNIDKYSVTLEIE